MTSTQTVSKPSSGAGTRAGKPQSHTIGIAGIKVVRAPETVRTVLGSCIGVALFDRVAKVGAMGHVILPSSEEGSGDPGKFADSSVDILLEKVVEAGAGRKRVIAKIAGGAAMFGDDHESSLGRRNEDAVIERLKHHGIRLAASACGGNKGRKMLLDPSTGGVQVEIIGAAPEVI